MPKKVESFSFGLLGWPLKKSLSPAIFRFFFKKKSLKGKYRLLPIKNFSASYLKNCSLNGLNITSPYKQMAFSLSEVKTESAKKVKAANLLKRKNVKWISYNTDLPAFKKSLRRRFQSACVFGSGGAAAAVLTALAELKSKEIFCISLKGKRPANAQILKKNYPNTKFYFLKQKEKAPLASIYVNARIPKASFPEFPPQAKNSLFYDLNYFGKNQFISKALKLKAKIKTGEEMLFYQALYGFQIFTGLKIKENEVKNFLRRL